MHVSRGWDRCVLDGMRDRVDGDMVDGEGRILRRECESEDRCGGKG